MVLEAAGELVGEGHQPREDVLRQPFNRPVTIVSLDRIYRIQEERETWAQLQLKVVKENASVRSPNPQEKGREQASVIGFTSCILRRLKTG